MSHFRQVLCRDVRVCFFAFLGPKDQANLRAVSKDSIIDFNHAAQRGYVPVMVCEEYVEDANEIHQDGEDGHPKFHFGPGDQKNFFASEAAVNTLFYEMQRSEKDKNATLVVNVAKMLGKGETKLRECFLFCAQFKAVHFIGTESLEQISDNCLTHAHNLACFTMSTPCPKLTSVGNSWLSMCSSLIQVCFRGCTALESVGDSWLFDCSSVPVVTFGGCSALESVGGSWLAACKALQAVDFSALGSLRCTGWNWLSGCSSLKIANFAGCSALEEVGAFWMKDCALLEAVQLEACVSLTRIDTYQFGWLRECPSLRRVVLPDDCLISDDALELLGGDLE